MQHRWHADRLAYFAQAGTSVLERRLTYQIPLHSTGDGAAASLYHQNVVLEKLFDHVVMVIVLLHAWVIAADVGDHAPNTTGHDSVI